MLEAKRTRRKEEGKGGEKEKLALPVLCEYADSRHQRFPPVPEQVNRRNVSQANKAASLVINITCILRRPTANIWVISGCLGFYALTLYSIPLDPCRTSVGSHDSRVNTRTAINVQHDAASSSAIHLSYMATSPGPPTGPPVKSSAKKKRMATTFKLAQLACQSCIQVR